MCGLSAVIPVYGCGNALAALHAQLTEVLPELTDDYEIIFVDDRSPDGAWAVLESLAESDPHTRALRLSRNFGQHTAITAGLDASSGQRVVVMDCDGQDPPREIARLWAKADEGFDIVFGRRIRAGASHSLLRRIAAKAYFRVINAATGNKIDPANGTFSLLSRKVVDAYLRLQDRDRHYLFVLYWLGYETSSIDYEHDVRAEGRSSYTWTALLRHALGGIFFQTTAVLRWIVYLGFLVSALGVGMALFLAVAKLTGSAYPGWTSLAVFTLTIGGVMLISTGVTALYVGKIFEQVKGRPLYVVDAEVGERVERDVRA